MEMTNREAIEAIYANYPPETPENYTILREALNMAISLLKKQEAVEPHYTTLRYFCNGKEAVVQHPECPQCIKNGLMLWDAEIEKGQAYCKRCGQAVKWDGLN